MGQKQKRISQKTETATGLGRRTREEIELWDRTDSPEIPDRGETSEIPPPPFGGNKYMFPCMCSKYIN